MCFAFKPDQSADCGYATDGEVSTHRGNFNGNYPPLFYGTMGIFASPDIGLSTILMRLFNSALFVGAVALVVTLLRRGQRGPLLWGAAVTMVPLGMFIVPSVNPSSWAVLAGLTVWIATAGYFTAVKRGSRIALGALAVLLAILGAGSRGDAAAYVALAAVVAAILTFRRARDWLKLAILPAAIIVIGAVFFLSTGQSTSYVSTAVIQGASDLQLADPGAAVASQGLGSSLRLLFENLLLLPGLWAGVLGSWKLGWLDTPMYDTVWVATIGAFSAVMFWGLRVLRGRKALALALVLLALVVVPLYILYGLNARIGEEVQPRYILPLFVMFAGVALYGFTRDDLGLSRVQASIVLFGLAVANSLALHMNMRRYITGIDFKGANLNSNIEWWWAIPVSPMVVWFAGSAGFALLLFGLYFVLFTSAGRRLMPQTEGANDGETPNQERVRREPQEVNSKPISSGATG